MQAVFFDCGNTLIEPTPPVGVAYARAMGAAGVEADPDVVQERFVAVFRRLSRVARASGRSREVESRAWWRRVVRETTAPFGTPADPDAVFEWLWDYFGRAEAWSLYADVIPTLDALRDRGVPAGLLSNWDERLRPLLDELGLTPRLRWIVISHEVGADKPARGIFRHAAGLCGLPPAQILHVGDSREADVAGALEAGMRAAWLRRDGRDPWTSDPAAVDNASVPGALVVHSLAEVVDLLD